jgi:hypothetical protein
VDLALRSSTVLIRLTVHICISQLEVTEGWTSLWCCQLASTQLLRIVNRLSIRSVANSTLGTLIGILLPLPTTRCWPHTAKIGFRLQPCAAALINPARWLFMLSSDSVTQL